MAAAAVLLGRLQRKAFVNIGSRGRVITLPFDAGAPFSNLLAAAANPFTAGASSTPDAFVEMALTAGPGPTPTARDVLTLRAQHDSDGWMLSVIASGMPDDAAGRMLLYLATLLEHADPQQACGCLTLLSETDALELYAGLNATETPYPKMCVQEMVTEQAQIDPSADAVVFAGTPLSYAKLEEESNRLATLLSGMGADQQHPVALAMPRSADLPVVLLATLKAGSFFVPLDPTHPIQRLTDILDECKPAIVLVTETTAKLFDGKALPLYVLGSEPVKTVYREASTHAARRVSAAGLDDKAYMIYTSGTTGKPKGVMISHRALVNFVSAAQRQPGLKRGDRWLAVTTLSFDISLMEMFVPLISGASVVIASEQDVRDPARLAHLLEHERITCMQATPTTWRMLLSHAWTGRKGMRMLCGGEALPRDLANDLLALDEPGNGELWNCYGPTETTIWSSFLRIRDGDGPVPIGPPIANTRFYIADAEGKLLPPEIAGELYIGGDGVAIGYFERPQLDREKFIRNPWAGAMQRRLFRTGDAARLRKDGSLDFFGRLDQQVKLRGYRIELEEIEAVLRMHPAVGDAAVILRDDTPGEPSLVAYLTGSTSPNAGRIDETILRAHAALRLPDYMLPARYVTLTQLPLTGSGKTDKRALLRMPSPDETAPNSTSKQPSDLVEASLLKVFREVLRLPSFGLDDNFFHYGGYSLLAVRLFARIGNVLGSELPITSLFDAPTVRSLAAVLREGQRLPVAVPIRSTGDAPPFFLVHSYLLYGLAAEMVPEPHPIYGLREIESEQVCTLQDRVRTCVDAIDRVYPEGRVHLGGWCAAATLTVEIARSLQANGRNVGLLALFDAEVPGFIPRPATGSPRTARLRAAVKYHLGRLRSVGWRGRFDYLLERISQHSLQSMEWIYTRHRRTVARLQRLMPFLPNVLFYNRWTQQRVEEKWQVRPIDTTVSLFRAADVILVPGSDDTMGWGEIARGGVEVLFVPGHHESMFHPPQLSVLAQEFAAALRRAENLAGSDASSHLHLTQENVP